MPNTPRRALPYPGLTNAPDIPSDIKALADAVDAHSSPFVCTSTTRPATPFADQIIYETDTSRTYIRKGAAWVPFAFSPKVYNGTIDVSGSPFYGLNNYNISTINVNPGFGPYTMDIRAAAIAFGNDAGGFLRVSVNGTNAVLVGDIRTNSSACAGSRMVTRTDGSACIVAFTVGCDRPESSITMFNDWHTYLQVVCTPLSAGG